MVQCLEGTVRYGYESKWTIQTSEHDYESWPMLANSSKQSVGLANVTQCRKLGLSL